MPGKVFEVHEGSQTARLLTEAIRTTNISRMNAIQAIRGRLGLTQVELGALIGVSQGNVSFYERGQNVPAPVAAKLIEVAGNRGLSITFDHVYGAVKLPADDAKAAA
jgi:putative transcriptional regulator